MPTYEYACTACSHGWEEIQKISAAPLEVCPACHKSTARRQISGGTFILKGGGWYADAYSSTSNKKTGEGGESKSASAESKTDAKPAETKTEAPKTDAKPDAKATSAAA